MALTTNELEMCISAVRHTVCHPDTMWRTEEVLSLLRKLEAELPDGHCMKGSADFVRSWR